MEMLIGIFSIVIGLALGLPMGIWAMNWYWKGTQNLWNVPLKDREKWLDEKRSDAFAHIMAFKIIAKGGLIVIAIFLYDVWQRYAQ